MKVIQNKATSLPGEKPEEKIDYKFLIDICVKEQKQEGFTLEDMRKRFKILDVLEESKEEIKLEDSDFETLKEIINKKRWLVLERDVLKFIDDINAIK